MGILSDCDSIVFGPKILSPPLPSWQSTPRSLASSACSFCCGSAGPTCRPRCVSARRDWLCGPPGPIHENNTNEWIELNVFTFSQWFSHFPHKSYWYSDMSTKHVQIHYRSVWVEEKYEPGPAFSDFSSISTAAAVSTVVKMLQWEEYCDGDAWMQYCFSN